MSVDVEQRLREALAARADEVTLADLRPPSAPRGPAVLSRWRPEVWLPALGGAAAATVIVVFAVLFGHQGSQVIPPAEAPSRTTPAPSAPMPAAPDPTAPDPSAPHPPAPSAPVPAAPKARGPAAGPAGLGAGSLGAERAGSPGVGKRKGPGPERDGAPAPTGKNRRSALSTGPSSGAAPL